MRIKLFVALPSEFPKEKAPLGVDVIYTGVGKINSAIKATEILKDLSPADTIVINYGSAGGNGNLVGQLSNGVFVFFANGLASISLCTKLLHFNN